MLTVPEWYKSTQPYQQNQIKHFLIAMRKGIEDDADEREEGKAYIQYEVRRQVRAGAKYLDINPDEVHYDLDTQKACMRFAVETVQEVSPIPPSIDSSNSEIIEAGLAAYDGSAGRPIINSVAAERMEALDMVVEHNARMVLMCTGPDGMPQNDQERVENLNFIMEHVQSKGIPLDDIYVDGIIFPISVDPQYGNHHTSMPSVRSVSSMATKSTSAWDSAMSHSECLSDGSSTTRLFTFPLKRESTPAFLTPLRQSSIGYSLSTPSRSR